MSDLADVLEPGWTISFETLFRREPIIRSWAAYRGPTPNTDVSTFGAGTHRFDFWQEAELAPLGIRPGKARLRAELICTADYRPIRYDVDIQGAHFNLVFGPKEIIATLPDSTVVEGSWSDADFLLAGNMVPQLAVKLRLLLADGALPYDGGFFSPESLRSTPYQLTREVDWIQSNLDERLHVDNDGWLSSLEIPEREILVRVVSRRPPRWRVAAPSPPAPPTPAVPGIRLRDLVVPGPTVELGATLAFPPVGIEHSATALFIGGSGRHDRHGRADGLDLGYHDLLDRLAARGISSLRFDKRGAGSTRLGRDIYDFGFEAVLADARAALTFVKHLPEVRSAPLFLIGHSQGGLVAIELAAEQPDLTGVALLATAARPLDEVLYEQLERQAATLEFDPKHRQSRRDDFRAFVRAVREVDQWTPANVPPKVYALRHLRRWYSEILARDPSELIGQLTCPILVMQCDQDIQVSVRDAELLYRTAIEAGIPAELTVLHNCDHLFKRARQGAVTSSYYHRRRRIVSSAVDTLSNWIGRIIG